jgi:hypothetical protein
MAWKMPNWRPQTGLPARVVSGTFPSPAHAEGHWLATSGAIRIYYVTDSSKYCMARLAYCIFWQN